VAWVPLSTIRIWGLLLGVPILMIVKAVCDRVDGLKPVGELLGT
jgi:predicted PurR-regulated permease PerM